MNEILPSSSLGPGPHKVGQKGLKLLYLWNYSQKIQNPKIFSLPTLRLAESTEGLNSPLAQLPGKLCSWWNMCKLLDLSWNCPATKVLTVKENQCKQSEFRENIELQTRYWKWFALSACSFCLTKFMFWWWYVYMHNIMNELHWKW